MQVTLRIACLIACTGLAMLGCGDDGTKVEEPEGPSVTQTSPADGAADTNINPLVEVWFDQAVDEAKADKCLSLTHWTPTSQ